ncbi:MAG: fumarate hydratase C-terminal domain-containing protein [Pseudomonadota bacterium]
MADTARDRKTVRLNTPVTAEAVADLRLGDVVYLDGMIYTGRERVYQAVLEDGWALPPELAGLSNVNFHCSPAAAQEDDGSFSIGAVTATASFRFAKWLPRWFEISGCRMIIGKGGMSEEVYKSIFVPAGAVYLTTVGYGTGALLGRGIKKVRQVFWLEELGLAQALWVFEVSGLGPFLVESDSTGASLFENNNRQINSQIESLYKGLKKPALSRYGETDDRKDELI